MIDVAAMEAEVRALNEQRQVAACGHTFEPFCCHRRAGHVGPHAASGLRLSPKVQDYVVTWTTTEPMD